MHFLNNLFICFSIMVLCYPIVIYSSSQGKLVEEWAVALSEELYQLGLIITKAREIEGRYKFNNAEIKMKDPEELLDDIVGGVTRMLNRKMDAIKCIVHDAETAAENFVANETFSYHSSKYSSYDDQNVTLPESLEENQDRYERMEFNIDSHFYNISVNTSYSSVHVPINIYDGYEEAAFAIQWSQKLDEVFVRNYESDPGLSWQYFGSSSGILRHYPAMRWLEINELEDVFDCRVRTWYIEAATCTKDIVILVDNSGSMTGMNKHIASLTVYTILNSLSNNDYVNILNYSTTVDYTVPCFKNKLIQATLENVDTFKRAVNNLDPQDKSNVEAGLIESFRLLETYREKRNCTEDNCNQAIMLITDGISRNHSDILVKYNSMKNGSLIPVRIFTYLIGKEINNLEEITWISCNNKGYFTLVSDLEQVTEAVFKYINVIARPLILQKENHPISWTHTYVDIYTHDTTDKNRIDEPYRLLTSAAIPAYNKKNYDNLTGDVQLLGVAGTDVTIESIQKLTFPYKLGVNAHAFIVTNNGYVLMHPGLRPMFKKQPTPNYNSIDFTEVQQLDDGSEPRQLAQILLDLRAALVHGERNVTFNVSLKYHYNNMQRVSRETFDFYYKQLKNTPFTMALALPNRFGYYAVLVPDEIEENKHASISILKFFSGDNWRIHPKWVYCKYHYLEGHEYDTPEKELLHFLGRMYNQNFTWNQQYEDYNTDSDDDPVECDTETRRLKHEDYYCDKELINMLVFDAKSTMQAFENPWTFKNDREEFLFKKYNATLRFVATMSGLTRWEYIFGEENKSNIKEFGDYHARAIDETWYKSAVLQHQYDKNSFVYSVPLFSNNTEDILVTGSYAIFPKNGSFEAPASVVGFQFSQSHLMKNFFNIAKNIPLQQQEHSVPCGEHLDCYIIDSSGYIIVSHSNYHTGRFFGEVEGCVLESMLEKNIFDSLPLYDYQSLCYRKIIQVSKGSKCSIGTGKTFSTMYTIMNWIIERIFWLIIDTNLYQTWYPLKYATMASDDENTDVEEIEDIPVTEADDVEIDKNHEFVPCDHRKYLYILNQSLFITGDGFAGEILTNCPTKFYYAKMIPKSNLLLVAVRFNYTISENKYTTKPERIIYENDTKHPCQKLQLNDLTRRRLLGCYNSHPAEREITACGYSFAVPLGQFFSFTDLLLIICLIQAFNFIFKNA